MRDFVKALRKDFDAKVKANKLQLGTSCCKCGRTCEEEEKKLSLHNIIPISSCPPERGCDPNVQENLITLYHNCHLSYHRCFEDSYLDERVMDWLRDVPLEDVDRLLADYRADREARRRFHMNKHRNTGRPTG